MVIHDMRIGGAQKSLLSFLQCFVQSQFKEQYEISLLVIDPKGPFMAQIPEEIGLLKPTKPLRWTGSSFGKDLLFHHFSMGSLMGEGRWLLRKATKSFPKGWNLQQKLWDSWSRYIPAMEEHYDIAIAYMDGIPNYYVTDKVSADKKVLWVHSEYQKQGYHSGFDHPYYQKADRIITISENCKLCIQRQFPDLQEKIHVLENITPSRPVLEKSKEGDAPEFSQYQGLKLLSVARLNRQKGIDLAVEAAELLRQEGIDFLWLVAGDGPEREDLENRISALELGDRFQLLGSRENPYVYMAGCDILIQPSRVEGQSLVLREAKVLHKPIVATNYTTVGDSLCHEENGLIVEMTPRGIADGVLRLVKDNKLKNALIQNLQAMPQGNEDELSRYISVMM